jgi:hypothetical protein
MEHTKGKVKVSQEPFVLLVTHELETSKRVETICQLSQRYKTDKEIQANAELISDAFNTTNESGLKPSELYKHNQELLDALKSTKQLNLHLYDVGTIGNDIYNIIEQAINNAKTK